MSKIKKFFSRKKDEAAFKLKIGSGMGQGRALNAPADTSSSTSNKKRTDVYIPPKHKELSEEAKVAAAAALARIERKDKSELNISLAAIKAQAKRELEAERKLREEMSNLSTTPSVQNSAAVENKNLVSQGVYFRCPLIADDVLSKTEWKVRIKEFLYQQLEFDRGLTACLIIANCNTKEKTEDCIQTLTKYLENIIKHPEEEKYLKIRMSNRIFSEKVRYVEGAMEFLQAAGFIEVELDNEAFLIWSAENIEKDVTLLSLLEALQNAETIQLTLDRNIKVLLPSQVKRVVLPDDFYRITPEEIKREQQLRTEALENAQVLKTKAMREREEQKNLRMYRYALIRVKFPNGIHIQGTFNVYEKISDVYEFVQSCLNDEQMNFSLAILGEGYLNEEHMDKTLHELRLIPNSMLIFAPNDGSFSLQQSSSSDINYIKEELLMLVQSA